MRQHYQRAYSCQVSRGVSIALVVGGGAAAWITWSHSTKSAILTAPVCGIPVEIVQSICILIVFGFPALYVWNRNSLVRALLVLLYSALLFLAAAPMKLGLEWITYQINAAAK